MKQTNEQGRTMIEMLGVIAILAIMTVGAATAISFSLMLFRANHMYTEIEQISKGVTDLYSYTRNFETLSMRTVCENDVLPRACVTSADNMAWTNAFEGLITVESYTDKDFFQIRYTDIPDLVCRQLLCHTTWMNVIPIIPADNSSIEDDDCSKRCNGNDKNEMIFVSRDS